MKAASAASAMRWPGGGGGGNARAAVANVNWRRAGDHRVEIEMALRQVGEAIETRGKIGVLAGLHQAEMALGQCQRLVARQRADDRHVQRGDGVGHQHPVPFAADAVEHDAERCGPRGRDRAKPRTTAAAVCACAATSSTRSTGRPKRAARSAVAPERPGNPGDAVEQAHDAFDHQDLGVARRIGRERIEQRRRHRPAVEIDARRAGRGGMERGIDVVRACLGGPHRDAAPRQRRQQRKRDRGLAGA